MSVCQPDFNNLTEVELSPIASYVNAATATMCLIAIPLSHRIRHPLYFIDITTNQNPIAALLSFLSTVPDQESPRL